MLSKAFKPFTEKEVVTFERIRKHLTRWAMKGDERDIELLKECVKAAKAPGIKKPKAMFVSLVKKHTGFTGNGVIL